MRIRRFEVAQRFRTVNRSLQVVLFGCACLLIFILSYQRLPAIDITRDGRYSLTPETVAYLQAMDMPVEIIGSLSLGESSALGSDRLRELQNLTERYASLNPRIKLTWVDGFRAQGEYGFKNPYRLLLRTGQKSVWITPEELYSTADDVFMGERALTTALWRLVNPQERPVLVVTPSERWEAEGAWGFRRLSEYLGAKNSTVEQIEPGALGVAPIRADVVFVLGGSDMISAEATAALQRYINDQGGHIFVAIDEPPSAALERFLYFNGVVWQAARVQEINLKRKTPMGETLLRDFAQNPMVESLRADDMVILTRGHWWSFGLREAMVQLQGAPVLYSSAEAIATPDKERKAGTAAIQPPYNLIVAVARKSAEGAPLGRLVVAGASDFFSNAYVGYRGNMALLEASYNYLTASNSLQSIPERGQQARQLGLTTVQLWRMGGWMLACVLVLVLAGVVRFATRPR